MTDSGRTDDDGQAWAALFERGDAHGVSIDDVKAALAARRSTDREGEG